MSKLIRQIIAEVRFSDREYSNPEALWRLTQEEYLEASNTRGAWHSMDAYEPREKEVYDDTDPVVNVEVMPNREHEDWRDVYWTHKSGKWGYRGRQSPMGLETEQDRLEFARERQDDLKKARTVKDYWYRKIKMAPGEWSPNQKMGYELSEFPLLLKTTNGIQYRARKDDQNNYTIAAFDGDECVGTAADEWGAYLVTVSPDHRGRGIGKTLAHIFLAIRKPHRRDSGGYTSHGIKMAKQVHAQAVRDAEKLGWYSRAVKDGTLTQEKADEIIASTKPTRVAHQEPC